MFETREIDLESKAHQTYKRVHGMFYYERHYDRIPLLSHTKIKKYC